MNKLEVPSITSVSTWEDIFNAYNRNFNAIEQCINTNGFTFAAFIASSSNISNNAVVLESTCGFDNDKDVIVVFKNNILQVQVQESATTSASTWDYYISQFLDSDSKKRFKLVFNASISDSDDIRYFVLSGIDLTGDISAHVEYIEGVKASAEELQKDIDVSRGNFNEEWSKIISVCNWIINNMESTEIGDYVTKGDRTDAVNPLDVEWKEETASLAVKKKVVLEVSVDIANQVVKSKCQYEFISSTGLLYKVSEIFYETSSLGDYILKGNRTDATSITTSEWKQETATAAIKKKIVTDVYIDTSTNKLMKKCQYEYFDSSGLLYKVSDYFGEEIADIEVHNHNLPN